MGILNKIKKFRILHLLYINCACIKNSKVFYSHTRISQHKYSTYVESEQSVQ